MLPLPRPIRVRFNILFCQVFPAKLTIHTIPVISGALKWNAYTFNVWKGCLSECDGHVSLSAPHTSRNGSAWVSQAWPTMFQADQSRICFARGISFPVRESCAPAPSD
ncbi:hypothetical protein ACN38_g7937 [Penicillium nordicum]|uniref:Uncharacterized protein n=1 Tax=Penicillium nordicum TaxID=229535 RepID=A0A0M9WDY8_9EURO|nr:hypothetical protein ACN38_g7937 [Penicillium nordicum]